MTKIVAISDTHGQNLLTKWDIPDGDILVHAGDGTTRGLEDQIKEFNSYLSRLPHRFKIFVPGNHDKLFFFDPQKAIKLLNSAITLIDETVELLKLRIYGMPWLPNRSGNCSKAFEADDLLQKTDQIPLDTDILVTHTGPLHILDNAWRSYIYDPTVKPPSLTILSSEHMGNGPLANKLRYGLNPKLHVFGHIHEAYGQMELGGIKFVNASLVDRGENKPKNQPIVIEI